METHPNTGAAMTKLSWSWLTDAHKISRPLDEFHNDDIDGFKWYAPVFYILSFIFACFLIIMVMAFVAPIAFLEYLHKTRLKLSGARIGKRVYLDRTVFIDTNGLVIIEDEVTLTRGVIILTHSRKCPYIHPVTIKKGAFIGVNSVILGGITIGAGAIVGAGSIVTHDVPDHDVVAGNPAKRIGGQP